MELEQISTFVSAINDSHWVVITGFTLMFIVFLSRKVLKPILNKKDTDLFVAGTAIIYGIAVSLINADRSWLSAAEGVIAGLTVGATAIGFWELVGARLRDYVNTRKKG